jgi:uncharacterized membrane protein
MKQKHWTLPMKLLAYAVMSAISLGAIYLVDVKVHRMAIMPRSTTAR